MSTPDDISDLLYRIFERRSYLCDDFVDVLSATQASVAERLSATTVVDAVFLEDGNGFRDFDHPIRDRVFRLQRMHLCSVFDYGVGTS